MLNMLFYHRLKQLQPENPNRRHRQLLIPRATTNIKTLTAMTPFNIQLRPGQNSRATFKTKRKHPFDDKEQEQYLHHIKKQKKSISKTLTLRPQFTNRENSLTLSNSFQSIHSSSFRKKRNKRNFEPNRKWAFSLHDFFAHKDRIVFVSYNILGVENALKHPDLYSKVPLKFLQWDRRKELICKEMNHYNAGILCFQEVDFFDDLDGLLRKDGFRGVYKARTGEACDGCAIFWKDKLFTLLHEEHIEFQSFGLRNNVAQLCVLKMNENESETDLCMLASKTTPTQSRSLVVANIHVLFNPSRGDIKLGQVRIFLERAYKLSQEWGSIPVIVGGDLNSLPQSAIYQFLASSELDVLLHDRRNMSGQLEHPANQKGYRSQKESVARSLTHRWSDEELKLATGSEAVHHLRHQLKLSSAYLGVPGIHGSRGNLGEPLATSYHSRFMGTVDYIWHTEDLVPVRVLDTLPIKILRRSKGLPDKRWGSDHLALVCELAFKNDGINA